MLAALCEGEYLATVAVMVVAQVKVKASTKEELHAAIVERLTNQGQAWKLEEFAVKEASVQVTPLSGRRVMPVMVKASSPEELLSADRANVVAAS